MKANYRLVLAIQLEVDDEMHAKEAADALVADGLHLGSNWEDLNPCVTVEDVERT